MDSRQGEDFFVGTIQKTLCGNRSRKSKFIDMEWVYGQLAKGRTREDVADELGVCVSTLYNHHRKYQKQLEVLLKEREFMKNNMSTDSSGNDDLPPLPPEFRI